VGTGLKRFAILAVLLVTGMMIAVPVVSQSDAAEGDQASVGEAVRFRESVGFRSDRDFVAGTFDDPDYSPEDWSVPLSRGEAADLERRVEIQRSVREAHAFAREQPEYAGVYLDQQNHGRPVFLFTGKVDTLEAQVARLLPDGTEFTVRRVSRSWSELGATKAAIMDDRKSLAADGIDVTLVGRKARSNDVVVGVMELTDAARRRLARFGDEVTVVEQTPGLVDACYIYDCAPMKSGLRIVAQDTSFCTAGYLANRTDTNPDQRVIVTAGHCIALSGPPNPQEWRHHGETIGDEYNQLHTWVEDANADVGMIKLTELRPSVWDQIFYMAGPPAGIGGLGGYYAIQQEEDLVCRVGAGQGGRRCGVILRVDDSARSCEHEWTNCRWIDHINVADFDSEGGDSGGPVYLKDDSSPNFIILYGTHVHSGLDSDPDSNSWFSEIGYGLTTLSSMHGVNLQVCLNASCT
jgi:hypothetical protein